MTEPRGNKRGCPSCAHLSFCVLSAASPEVLHRAPLFMKQLSFDPGETIFHGETLTPSWVILCQGKAKLVLRTRDGRQLLLWYCRPGDLLVDTTRRMVPCAALAVTLARVALLPGDGVARLMLAYPEVLAEVNRRLVLEKVRLLRRLADLAYGSTRGRLVRVLLELREEHGVAEEGRVRIDLPFSLSDLAAMIGASRQATSKELRVLCQRGLLQVQWPWIFLADEPSLCQFQ